MKKNGIVKQILIAAALLLAMSQGFASGIHVPGRVMQQFNAMYPNAQQVDWKKNHGFEADFRLQDKTGSLVFDRKGDVRYSKIDVNFNEVPAAVINSVNSNFIGNGFEQQYAMHRWSKSDGETYDVVIHKGRDQYLLRYAPDGTLVSQFSTSKHDKLAPPVYYN